MREVNTFCETPEEGCTMSYCDDNGCLNRECNYVEESVEPLEKSFTGEELHLLDYFAGEALQSIIIVDKFRTHESTAEEAYRFAKEMVKERRKQIK